jgi:DNA-binding response OmpR family regulator
MPGMTGVELARRVRESHPKLPILFASGYADVQTFGDELSDENMLKKPYRIADLAARIAALLTEKRSGGNVVELRR